MTERVILHTVTVKSNDRKNPMVRLRVKATAVKAGK